LAVKRGVVGMDEVLVGGGLSVLGVMIDTKSFFVRDCEVVAGVYEGVVGGWSGGVVEGGGNEGMVVEGESEGVVGGWPGGVVGMGWSTGVVERRGDGGMVVEGVSEGVGGLAVKRGDEGIGMGGIAFVIRGDKVKRWSTDVTERGEALRIE
jgi:hypothetical protein